MTSCVVAADLARDTVAAYLARGTHAHEHMDKWHAHVDTWHANVHIYTTKVRRKVRQDWHEDTRHVQDSREAIHLTFNDSYYATFLEPIRATSGLA